jgi:enoyl-CoA hydratase/carnithine racemase
MAGTDLLASVRHVGEKRNNSNAVELTVDSQIAILTLNRPDRLNAWNSEMESEYFDHLARLSGTPEIRAIVVTGSGNGFCAGADFDDLVRYAESGSDGVLGPRKQTFALTVGKPVIAAINGACVGIGLVQALMCDFRFAASGAKFATGFAKLGLIAEHGMSWLLAKHVGLGHALDLLLSSRIVLADEAARLGLIHRVCDPAELLADAVSFARMLADTVSPSAMATIKSQVYEHYGLSLDEAVRRSNELMYAFLDKDDFRAGIAAMVGRRAPYFPGLPGSQGAGR